MGLNIFKLYVEQSLEGWIFKLRIRLANEHFILTQTQLNPHLTSWSTKNAHFFIKMGRFWSKNENKWFYPNTYQLIAVCYAPKSVFYPPKDIWYTISTKIWHSRLRLAFLHNKVMMISNHYLEINLLGVLKTFKICCYNP